MHTTNTLERHNNSRTKELSKKETFLGKRKKAKHQSSNKILPAFSMKPSHFSASLTLTIRCSGAYKFEKETA